MKSTFHAWKNARTIQMTIWTFSLCQFYLFILKKRMSSLALDFSIVVVALKTNLKVTWFTIANTLKNRPLMKCIIAHVTLKSSCRSYFQHNLMSKLAFYTFFRMTLWTNTIVAFILFTDPIINIFSLTTLQTGWLLNNWLLQNTFMKFFNTISSIWTMNYFIMCFPFF